MDIDSGVFSFEKVYPKLKSTVWYQKVDAMETVIRFLVDLDPDALLYTYSQERIFPLIVTHAVEVLNTESITKVVEVYLDFIEFLISSLPEAIINQVSEILIGLIRHI
jgi:hypothetical protein